MQHVIRTVPVLPDAQARPLLAAYAEAMAARRRRLLIGLAVATLGLALSVIGAEVEPGTLWAKIGNFTSYFERLSHLDSGAHVWTDPGEWFWGLRRWLRLLGETVVIAYLGTMTGALVAFLLCFLASANLMRSGAVRLAVRRVLEFCRTVPDLVFALIFVVAFGLGALPGVLAIALHTAGTLGKLFAEVVENVDLRPIEGIAAAGGSWFAQVRFGVLPQVLANFLSYALLRFEINVRGAAVIGFVGAGGIGEELIIAIRKFYYSDTSAILVLIILSVMVMDLVSERLRHRLARVEAGR